VIAGGACIALLLGAAVALRRRVPLAALGIAWFLVALLPESSLVPIRDVMVEHRTYLPMAGLCWAAAGLLGLLSSRRARIALPALAIAGLLVATHARNRVWRSEVSLWSDVTRKSPHKARGFNNLAMALEATGRTGEAEAAYRRSLAIEPGYLYGRVNLGRLLGLSGRFRESVQVLEEARRLAPREIDVLVNLGNAWWGLGDTARAVTSFEQALEVDPSAKKPAANLARLRGQQ
jgi:Flp pilus assembly protein TadD